MYDGVSAGTITFNIKTGKVLMIKEGLNTKPHWSFPKGHIEPGEKPQEAAIRETFEETGVRVKIIRKVFEDEVYRLMPNKVRYHKTIILYAAVTEDLNTKPQVEEVFDARFVFVHNVLYELKQNRIEFIKPFLHAFNIISNKYKYLYNIK